MIGSSILAAYALVLCGLLGFSLHRGWLVLLYRRLGHRRGRFAEWRGDLPAVTVQLPVYNERFVVERLIDAVCALDYPHELLEIQVLDDSSDETVGLARRRIEHHRRNGVDIAHLRRGRRTGYKAGALAFGMSKARGEFVLILDADFVPGVDLLKRLLPPFADPAVGVVQARWGHLNEGASWLTRAEALLLDGQFHIEHVARSAAGLFLNFNGTAGMWRVSCLRDAGGWQADTLTEDLDVRYRAQMRGWRFVYLPNVVVPAELPQRVRAFKTQQARWAQGSMQTARKLLPTLLRGDWPWRIKLEAFAHLIGHLAAPLTVALTLLVFPAIIVRFQHGWPLLLLVDLVFFACAMGPLSSYYAETLRSRGQKPWPRLLLSVPLVMTLGIGVSVNNSRAVLIGLFGRRPAEFVRTPKGGDARSGYRATNNGWATVLETLIAVYLALAVGYALINGLFASVPFLMLIQNGFAVGAAASLAEPLGRRVSRARS
jgi:cellulose synthase/poly-beta-1,6-N-acetylglucosamine synthase-like glycosyltransferase